MNSKEIIRQVIGTFKSTGSEGSRFNPSPGSNFSFET
jgi:hypothetical protein